MTPVVIARTGSRADELTVTGSGAWLTAAAGPLPRPVPVPALVAVAVLVAASGSGVDRAAEGAFIAADDPPAPIRLPDGRPPSRARENR